MQIEDWERVNACLYRLYRELDSEKHSRVMLRVLHELVPADSLALNIGPIRDPQKLSAIDFPENHATPEQVSMIGRYLHESPLASYFLATLDAQWRMVTDFIPLEDFQKTNLHRLALEPLGINYQIFSVLGVLDEQAYGKLVEVAASELVELFLNIGELFRNLFHLRSCRTALFFGFRIN